MTSSKFASKIRILNPMKNKYFSSIQQTQ